MATRTTTESRTERGRPTRSGSTVRKSVTTETILDLAQRLGVFDIFIDRVRGRLEEIDIDDFLDDVGDYVKRNPEVIIVALGTITVAAGAIVYLDRRDRFNDRDWGWGRDREQDEEGVETERPQRSAAPSASRTPLPASTAPRRRAS